MLIARFWDMASDPLMGIISDRTRTRWGKFRPYSLFCAVPYAVLGHPIGHSLSPVMHNANIEALGLDAVYLAFDVDPARLMSVLPAMREMGFGGVNLTVPLKEVAFNGIGDLDAEISRNRHDLRMGRIILSGTSDPVAHREAVDTCADGQNRSGTAIPERYRRFEP